MTLDIGVLILLGLFLFLYITKPSDDDLECPNCKSPNIDLDDTVAECWNCASRIPRDEFNAYQERRKQEKAAK